MCGIAIILGHGALSQQQQMDAMVSAISHRGEVTEQHSTENFLGTTRRLKIVDREHAQQPLFNSDRTKCVFFNGEIFNHQALREELQDSFSFTTASDTEVIMAAYEAWGSDCFQHFIGQYAFVVVDLTANACIMGRDEIGIIPLYYTQANGLLYIASEIKALTFLGEKIDVVLPGTWVDEGLKVHPHFVPKHALEYNDPSTFIPTLKSAITESIRTRVDTDLPIGIIYSGGLDSSVVLSRAVKFHKHVTAFTVGTEGSEDFEISQRYCKENNIRQVVIDLDKKSFGKADVKEAIEASELTEYGDIINAVISMRLFERIKSEGIKVVLGGDGSDELFGGYDMYSKESSIIDLFNYKLMNLHRTELQRVDRCSMAHSVEVRVPFLDKHLVQMSLSIPKEWKIKEGIEKWCVREAFKDELPDYIIKRRKNPLSHSSGLHEWVRLYKRKFAQYHKQAKYHLHEPIHKDFSFVLRENEYDLDRAIAAAKRHEDYSSNQLLMEYAKASVRKLLR